MTGFYYSEPEIVDEPFAPEITSEIPHEPSQDSYPTFSAEEMPSVQEDLGIQDAPVNISYCGFSFSANTDYVLNQSISSSGTCLTVNATNVTVDCQGKMINYSQVSQGAGINITGFNSSTIKNCNIVQGNSSQIQCACDIL